MNSSKSSDLPTLSTFVDIFNDMIDNWCSCEPWSLTKLRIEIIFYISVVLFLFYCYVIAMIIKFLLRTKQPTNPFYHCAVVLAFGEIITLVTCARDGVIQGCALNNIVPRYYAFEAVGVFCVDLTYTVNLIMAIYRLSAMLFFGRSPRNVIATDCMLVFALFYATATSFCCFKGLMKNISFPENKYYSYFLFPFDVIRTPIQMGQLLVTFLLYVGAFIQLRMIKLTRSASSFNKEYRFLVMASLIFLCELGYFYVTDWIGSRIFHLGSDEFNGNLKYFLRPITVGITPFFYIIFSSEIRRACFHPFQQKQNSSILIVPIVPQTMSTSSLKRSSLPTALQHA